MKKLSLLITVLIFTTTYSKASELTDASLSWSSARVFLPDLVNSVDVKYINHLNQTYPVVLYLHGCAGINKDALNWANYIRSLGFMVVLPDSMARKGRVRNCDPKLKRGNGAFPAARIYRQQEINFSLNQILIGDWAQKKNIFLMGHSEGGWAAAQSGRSEFAGVIISGATCTNRINVAYDGINVPVNIPVLAVASVDDEWHANKPSVKGRCADKAMDRIFFRQIDIPGSVHATSGSSLAREAVKQFLLENFAQSTE